MHDTLAKLIFWTGLGQLSVLVASALVPWRLRWGTELAQLPRLHRQLFWIYGGYIVLTIIAFGVISLQHAEELAAGGSLARGLCTFIALFWGMRLCLQRVLDVKPHLPTWWLRWGYRLLGMLFFSFTVVYVLAALAPTS